ncbi:MAG: hypothetical protein KTR20_14785 [Cellvibrionaceae bacterium]|nr:hypothetical protein [Cellvibrionaceae bacterium]
MYNVLLTAIICSVSLSVLAENYTVGQKDRKFSTDALTIKKGDTVDFVNEDDEFHNVFSLSDAKLFDLGSYPKGESKSVTFDEAGLIEIECAIHPDMLMEITVEE